MARNKMSSFISVPAYVKQASIFDNLNLRQLQIASTLDRQSRDIVRPIIRQRRRRARRLFGHNYNTLYNHIDDDPPNHMLLRDIADSYGDKYLFYDFLLQYFRLRAHTRRTFVRIVDRLQQMAGGGGLLDEFLRSASLQNFYESLG